MNQALLVALLVAAANTPGAINIIILHCAKLGTNKNGLLAAYNNVELLNVPVLGFQLKMGHSQIQAHLACATSAVIMASTMYGDPKFIFFEARQSCSNAVANMGKIQIDSLPLISTILVFAAQNPHITVNIVCWSALVRHSIWPLVWHHISPTLTFSYLPLHIGNVACGDQRTGNWMMSRGAFEAKLPGMRAFAPQVLDALLQVFFPHGGLIINGVHKTRRIFRTTKDSRQLVSSGDVNVVPPGCNPAPDTAVGPGGGAPFPVYYDDGENQDSLYSLWPLNDPVDYQNYCEQVAISKGFASVNDANGQVLRTAASSMNAHYLDVRAKSRDFAPVFYANGQVLRTAASSMQAYDLDVRAKSRDFAPVFDANGQVLRTAASSMRPCDDEVRARSKGFAPVVGRGGNVLRSAASMADSMRQRCPYQLARDHLARSPVRIDWRQKVCTCCDQRGGGSGNFCSQCGYSLSL